MPHFAVSKPKEILSLSTGDHPENQVDDLLESCMADNLSNYSWQHSLSALILS